MPSEPIIVKVMPCADCADVAMPVKMTAGAAGYDVSAAVDQPVEIPPGEIRVVRCGFRMALPPGWEAQMRPRSGLASRHGVTLVNSPGTIDCDYRGEVMVPLINLSKAAFTVSRGMRIAQMLVQRVAESRIELVSELDSTPRGEGGFGHTGR